jgi:hypothetical protein
MRSMILAWKKDYSLNLKKCVEKLSVDAPLPILRGSRLAKKQGKKSLLRSVSVQLWIIFDSLRKKYIDKSTDLQLAMGREVRYYGGGKRN